jgi:hypothetical protein
MRVVLLGLLLVACGGTPPEAPAPPPPPPLEEELDEIPAPPPIVLPPPSATAMDGDLEWSLAASATTITMAERASWELRTLATNRGTEPVDVLEAGFSSFTVNGEPSITLSMAFGNGISPVSWSELPPGETADPARSGFGEDLFPAPGDYEIVMTHGNALVGITIHVTGAAAATPGASVRDGDLEYRLTASSTSITMADRDTWELRIEATNVGTTPVDFIAVNQPTFRVDGEPSMALNMAFGNGGVPSTWAALPPGVTANPARVGVSVFDAPGDHTIEMTTSGGAVVSLVVHVAP